ncbi:hypothetical protein KIN20_008775 [Parelaphostrongylus tenuis]|uniref:Uncharacterized protein n=1 Tax=Parelaphostrongylus tenuis TaxID=148309 RepID=A0AAD5M797_PARTN|nr:hypothetical protein KIN20_008775 [Parelaphostrongylus tenuis]
MERCRSNLHTLPTGAGKTTIEGRQAVEMGLGKTLLVIALIAAAMSERQRRRIEGRDGEDKERGQIARQEG